MRADRRASLRLTLGRALLAVVVAAWLVPSDVVELIARQRPVLLGRYSPQHFAALVFGCFHLGLLGLLLLRRRLSFLDVALRFLLVSIAALATLGATFLATGWQLRPRYVTGSIERTGSEPLPTRHRPPGLRAEMVYHDRPEPPCSYPEAPAGYPSFSLLLSTDSRGFRNRQALERADVVVLGDSFAAGSRVSDEQVWTEILARQIGRPLYNLGASGCYPEAYLGNFLAHGRQLRPRTVLLTLYEGNDLRPRAAPGDRGAGDPGILENLRQTGKASLAWKGIVAASKRWLEPWGCGAARDLYRRRMAWMPLEVAGSGFRHHYAFKPKRLSYLAASREELRASTGWRATADVLGSFARLSREEGFRLVVLFVPSKPHVVLPLVAASIPEQSFREFLGYRMDAPPGLETVLERLDVPESAVSELAGRLGVDFLSLTAPLREAVARGQQVYYTYDQHWSPAAHPVVALEVARQLRTR